MTALVSAMDDGCSLFEVGLYTHNRSVIPCVHSSVIHSLVLTE